MKETKYQNNFIPIRYLSEQYAVIERDDEFIIRFLHETYGRLPEGFRLLEVGGGPTLYQLISASRRAAAITFTDYLPSNLETVEQWLQDRPGAFNWDHYFKRVLTLEGQAATAAHVWAIRQRLRRAVIALMPLDITAPRLPRELTGRRFEAISSNFCLAEVAKSVREYARLLSKLRSWLVPGGYLVMTTFKNRTTYRVGRKVFPVLSLDEETLRRYLTRQGFQDIEIQTIDVVRSTGPNTFMCVTARRGGQRPKKLTN